MLCFSFFKEHSMSTSEISSYLKQHLPLSLNNEGIRKYSLFIYNQKIHAEGWLPLRKQLIPIFQGYVDILLKNKLLGSLTTSHDTYFNDIYEQILATQQDVKDEDASIVLHLVKRYEMHLLSNYYDLDNEKALQTAYDRMMRCFVEGNFELPINMGSCTHCHLDKLWLTFKQFQPIISKYMHTEQGIIAINVNDCVPE